MPAQPTGTIDLNQTSPIQFDDEVSLAITWSPKLKGNQDLLIEMVCQVNGVEEHAETIMGAGVDSPETLILGGRMKPWLDLDDPTVHSPATCTAKLYLVSGASRTLLDETEPLSVE